MSRPISIQSLYQHLPIKDDPRNIRLLNIHSLNIEEDNSILEGTLHIVTLSVQQKRKRPTLDYTALSYVWGSWKDRESQHTIKCSGCHVPITKNCYNALRRIRQLRGAITIWVDSICINQLDDVERSQQVTLMRDIYSQAKIVFVWLNFEVAQADHVSGIEFFKALSLEDFLGENRVVHGYRIDGVEAFLNNEWFSRGWTFQELLLAQDIVFVTQTHTLEWHDVCRAIKRLENYLKSFGRNTSNSSQKDEIGVGRKVYVLTALVNTWNTISRSHSGSYGKSALIFDLAKSTLLYGVAASYTGMLRAICHDTYPGYHILRLNSVVYATMSNVCHTSLHQPLRFGKTIYFVPIAGNRRSLVSTCEKVIGLGILLWSLKDLIHNSFGDVLVTKAFRTCWTLTLAISVYVCMPLIRQIIEIVRDLLLILPKVSQYSGDKSIWQRFHQISRAAPIGWQAGSAGIMQALRTRHVKEVKDKVYSLYGVLQVLGVHLTPPNYSKSEGKTFQDFFVDLLKWRPMMLGFLADAGSSKPDSEATDVPSWVPRLQNPVPTSWLPSNVLYTSLRGKTLRRIRVCGFPMFEIKGRKLVVWARSVDIIKTCYQLPDLAIDSPDPRALRAMSAWMSDIIRHLNTECQSYNRSLVARILSLLLAVTEISSASYFDDRFIAWMEVIFNRPWHELTDDSRILTPPNSVEVQETVEKFRASKHIAETQVTLQNQICGKRLFFVTENGRFGTGSLKILPGDEVHFISGVPVPLCLRKHVPSDDYEIVGPSLIDEREAFEIWQGILDQVSLI